jgi:hypothetical protein
MKMQRKDKERPILMSAPMVRATLDDSKKQTRRAFSPYMLRLMECAIGVGECSDFLSEGKLHGNDLSYISDFCPYGQIGDRLWVKETYSQPGGKIHFRADEQVDHSEVFKWRPSIFMFRYLSRILLKIEDVRVERLQDISAADCCAEGIPAADAQLGSDASWRLAYQRLWESINGPESWKANPWVWAITFKRIQFPRIDALPK